MSNFLFDSETYVVPRPTQLPTQHIDAIFEGTQVYTIDAIFEGTQVYTIDAVFEGTQV